MGLPGDRTHRSMVVSVPTDQPAKENEQIASPIVNAKGAKSTPKQPENRIENDQFVFDLSKIFNNASSNIHINLKSYNGKLTHRTPNPENSNPSCLMRIKTTKSKLSTAVTTKNAVKISKQFNSVWKNQFKQEKKS